jgi:hypothetical protein
MERPRSSVGLKMRIPDRTAGCFAAGGRNTRSHAAPVIALRMEGLRVWVVERVAKSSREHKFTVGDHLVETCLDITSHLVEASYRRDKRHDLAAASRGLVRARVLARLARQLRCVSEAQHLHFVQESDEVGRMLGVWPRNATRSRVSWRRHLVGWRRSRRSSQRRATTARAARSRAGGWLEDADRLGIVGAFRIS